MASSELSNCSDLEITQAVQENYRYLSAVGHIILLVGRSLPETSQAVLEALRTLKISSQLIDLSSLSDDEILNSVVVAARETDTIVATMNQQDSTVPFLQALRTLRGVAESNARKSRGKAFLVVTDQDAGNLKDLTGRVQDISNFL